MIWTRRAPTEEGFYWMRSDQAPKPIVILITASGMFMVCGNDTPFRLDDRDFGRCEWAGPIEMPSS